MEIFIFITVFLISCAGVEIFRRWSLRRNLLDVPNERSSHTIPTVRGGGLVFVLICLTTYTFYGLFVTGDLQYGYLGGAILIAFISWLDDLYSISFVWRFLIHAAAAVLVIATLGYFQKLYVPLYAEIELGTAGAVVTFFWIVWLTNAYNFMDGIDGIAGMQAVTAGIGWLIVGKMLGCPSAGFYGGIIAFSCLGFLIRNWQPAKIFMGDVGSAFLGFSFAVLPLLAINEAEQRQSRETGVFLFLIGFLLVWLFVCDTVFTFFRRIFKGERFWEAHRGHLYQRFVIAGFSHRMVTGWYGLISILTILAIIWWLSNKSR